MTPEELELTIYGDPVLRERAEPVTEFGALAPLIERMFEVMYEEGGVGLAAPQVGVGQRIMVLDVPMGEDDENHVGVLINPEIIETEGSQTGLEGCLSIPGLQEEVTRHDRLRVRGVGANGEPVEFECTQLLSRAIQHEVDHLNGVLFIDRLSPVRRKLLAKKLKKIAEERSEART
jgi:peptide deformylase